MSPSVVPWADHLDAFEEWLRRTRAALEQSGDVAAVPTPATTPEGPLPEALRLRAAAGLAEVERLQGAVERRRAGLRRAQAYAQH